MAPDVIRYVLPYSEAFDEPYLLKIAYSWGDEESDTSYRTFEDAWREACRLAAADAEISSVENDSAITLKYDRKNGRIVVNYVYDGESCHYDIVNTAA